MHFMTGFATDEYYSTAHDSIYDGSADFSVGIAGMCPENMADNEAILSCYRPTAAFDGWEIRSGGAWSASATQLVQVAFGENTGPAEVEVTTSALTAPHTMVFRPFFYVVTFDVSAGGTIQPYINGIADTNDVNAGGVEPAQDAIVLGHGYDNAGAAARAGTHWYVNCFFLESSILSAGDVADIYSSWVNGWDLNYLMGGTLDHVWYAEDAKLGDANGETLATWYSRVSSAGTPKVMTATVDDGLNVTHYDNPVAL